MLLALEHVAKTHWVGPYEKRTLADVSLALAPGDFVGVWGAHRAGKSTLLRVAAGLDAPDRGTVRFDGADIAALSKRRLAALRLRDVGLVLGQGPQSADFTVADYVALPLLAKGARRRARKRALDVLRRLDIAECRDARWSQLSDSERALAGLAHALAREPRLLLADDPAAGLDALQEQEVVGLLRELAAESGLAVLMTSATLSALSAAHEAFTLGDGVLEPVTAPGGAVVDFPAGGQRSSS